MEVLEVNFTKPGKGMKFLGVATIFETFFAFDLVK